MATSRVASEVGANVRAEMARRRVSQQRLGVHLGLSQSALSNRIRGKVAFDVDEIHKVAAFLEVPVSLLLLQEAA